MTASFETYESRDFKIVAAALVLSEAAVTPQRGDRITLATGAVYEVTAPGGTDVYSADAFGRLFRIHTKLITT